MKHYVEKRRRTRVNGLLESMKTMVLQATARDVSTRQPYNHRGAERVNLPLCKVADPPFHHHGEYMFCIRSTFQAPTYAPYGQMWN